MKFKVLTESFGFNQSGIDMARAAKEKLEDFVNDLDVFENASECINEEEIAVLNEAIEILDSFYISYKLLASKKLRAYYANKKKDV